MRKSLQRQIFVRYALLLILAAVVIGGVLGFQNVMLLSEESDRLVENSLTTSASWLDARLTEMNAIGYHIMDANLLYPYQVFRNGYAAAHATTLLNSYKNANVYLSDIVLYYDPDIAAVFDSQPRYFTTTGAFDPTIFWNHIHPVSSGKLSPATLLNMPQRSSILYPVVESSKSSQQRYLLYLCPASRETMGTNRRGLIMFFMEDAVLRNGMANTAALYGGAFAVYGADGQLLYAYHEAQQHLSEIPDSYHTPMMRKNEEGLQMMLRTSAHGLTYVLSLPSGFADLAIKSTLAFLLPFILVLITLALWGAYAWLKPLLTPMQQLTDMLSPYSLQSDESLNGIVYSIRELEARKDRMEMLGNQRAILARIQFLHNLLQGSYSNQAELEDHMRLCECECRAERYLVLSCILLPDGEAKDYILNLRAAAMHVLTENVCMPEEFRYAVPENRENGLVLICGLPASVDAEKHAEQLYHAAREILLRETGAALAMGYGGAADSLLKVHLLYRQAKEALSQYYVQGEGKLLCCAQTRADLSTGWYPSRQEKALHSALVNGNTLEAVSVVQSIASEMRESKLPEHIVKSVCFSLLNGMIRLEETVYHSVADDHIYREMIRGIEAPQSTLQAFADSLCACCENFCARRARNTEDGVDENARAYCRRIEAYFQAHFSDQALTLSSVAAHFQLSEGHLSRIFKSCTGTTLMQYLDTLRMENAKKLLRETALPLNTVILQSGYVDKGNFYRKFKKLNGVTPVQYREMLHIEEEML